MYFVYILQSQLDKSFYIGFTLNVKDRLYEHNPGNTRYTKRKRHWNLVFLEKYDNKSEALKRERYLKRMKSKVYLEKLIDRARSSTVEQ